MSDHWRFIPYAVFDAADNMAIDEAILDAHLEGKSPPTLRLYGWKPPAVSIGYGQKLSSTVEERIRSHGFDIVRRPTGGRAVLHAHELTYSFVGSASGGSRSGARGTMNVPAKTDGSANQNNPANQNNAANQNDSTKTDSAANTDAFLNSFLSDSVVTAYKQICEGLIQAMQELGLELHLGASSSEYRNAHDCFLATTSADLHYNGKKMIGSAQLRRKTAVLQHGSILLDQPQDLMRKLLRTENAVAGSGKNAAAGSDNSENAAARHANLFEVLNQRVPLDRLGEAMKTGFESAFGQTLVVSELNEYETKLAREHRIKYQQKAAST